MERITERNFDMMSEKYQKEQLEVETRLKEVKKLFPKEEKEEHQSLHDRIIAIKQNSQRQEGKETAMKTTEACIG